MLYNLYILYIAYVYICIYKTFMQTCPEHLHLYITSNILLVWIEKMGKGAPEGLL